MANVLIIDDDPMFCRYMRELVHGLKHDVRCSPTLNDGLNNLSRENYDLVFLDVGLPDGDGLSALVQIRETLSSPEVIIITGAGEPTGAETAIKNGAWDYIQKPLPAKRMQPILSSVFKYRHEKTASPSKKILLHNNIIGNSPQMRHSFDLLSQAAFGDAGVLITGESGTGKELFARAVHDSSRRKINNFVIVDCASLPENLVESTLFGHEKGAFTSADNAQEGLINQAHRGTLFLDEIGELPLSVQGTFLRVLQGHKFRPIGGRHEIESDFRLIAATNRNICEMAENGTFRQDLLYRLKSLAIELPPLRGRSEDIRMLAAYYIKKLCSRYQIKLKNFSPDFIEILEQYCWPGNVRELINALEKSISAAQDHTVLFPKHLPTDIRVANAQSSVENGDEKIPAFQFKNENFDMFQPLKELLATTERNYLQDLIIHTAGDVKEICRISGISRSRIYERLKKYNISRRFLPSSPEKNLYQSSKSPPYDSADLPGRRKLEDEENGTLFCAF